jgi:hypothetical protein
MAQLLLDNPDCCCGSSGYCLICEDSPTPIQIQVDITGLYTGHCCGGVGEPAFGGSIGVEHTSLNGTFILDQCPDDPCNFVYESDQIDLEEEIYSITQEGCSQYNRSDYFFYNLAVYLEPPIPDRFQFHFFAEESGSPGATHQALAAWAMWGNEFPGRNACEIFPTGRDDLIRTGVRKGCSFTAYSTFAYCWVSGNADVTISAIYGDE